MESYQDKNKQELIEELNLLNQKYNLLEQSNIETVHKLNNLEKCGISDSEQEKNNTIIEISNSLQILEKELNNYIEIFNSTSDAIFIHNSETGKILDVNNSMLEMYGFNNKEEVLNANFEAFA